MREVRRTIALFQRSEKQTLFFRGLLFELLRRSLWKILREMHTITKEIRRRLSEYHCRGADRGCSGGKDWTDRDSHLPSLRSVNLSSVAILMKSSATAMGEVPHDR